ncbi:amino acid adenylation domain-containing protein [Streptomyces sp. BE147]|uniref:non-ribosomal peptide synthetase n=1 Tax=Streptomyces sp. BE147 TaxID=3002524 RepID=UPI002E75C0C5|nr:amino acid adenylation domain-containing protein [Streptomyces sp. BE147]MEE1739744.1 amino acid adenylation domain-containing protein [Streptomyces sp. BE147]
MSEHLTGSASRHEQLVAELLARGLGRTAPGAGAGTHTVGPLSAAQRRLWFLEQLKPGTAIHNIALMAELHGTPSPDVLGNALRIVQDRHSVLRCRFTEQDGEPRQEVVPGEGVPLVWHDLRAPSADADPDGTARRIAADCAERPFRLDEAPLFRCAVVLLPDDRWHLVLCFHHIVVDGWSVGVLLEELGTLLGGGSPGPVPSFRFLDWVADNPGQSLDPKDEAYWTEKLAGAPAAVTPFNDAPGRPSDHATGRLMSFVVPASTVSALERLATSAGTTAFVVLLSAFKVLLQRVGGMDDVVVGTPFAGRPDPRLDKVVGFFVNTLPLRTELAGARTFRDVLERVHVTVMEAQDHQDTPFDRIVELLGLSGTTSQSALFRTMLAWQNTPGGQLRWQGRMVAPTHLDTGTAKFDLTLSLEQTGRVIEGQAEWLLDSADTAFVDGFVHAYLELLRSLTGRPDAQLAAHALTGPHDEETVVPPAASPRPTVPHRTLSEPFGEQARRTPDAVALLGDEGTLTYAQLSERVERFAAGLYGRGVRPGDRVGVLMRRSFDMVAALHAVCAIGAAYVPLDPSAPQERLHGMLSTLEIAHVVAHGATADKVPDGPWEVVRTEHLADPDAAADVLPDAACDALSSQSTAYVLHTSGSTGRPKAVAYPTDASLAFLDWLQGLIPVGPGDRLLLKTPYGFDVSVWELFWPLHHGATIVVAEPDGHLDPSYLARFVQRHEVNVVNFVPSMLESFLGQLDAAGCPSLSHVLSAGEELKPGLVALTHRKLEAELINLYGPTEAGGVSYHLARPGATGTVPIGHPLPYVRLYVLDADLRPVPVGMPGELYIAGELGLADGYEGRPAATAEKFLPDPYSRVPGGRMYHTQDICRQLPGGELEYLGRSDRQVKLRGIRLEPAEIEQAMLASAGVAAARVLAVGSGPEQKLIGFYVPVEDAAPDPRALRRHLEHWLPRSIIPSALVEVEAIPTTPNGKTDQAALTAVWEERQRTAGSGRRPGNTGSRPKPADGSLEARVCAVFESVLEIPTADPDTGFFAMGGHSLQVLKLTAVCKERLGIKPSVATVFAHPTPRELALWISETKTSEQDIVVPLTPRKEGTLVIGVHAATGSALPYLPLSRALTDSCSFIGLQAPGLESDARTPSSVEEFIAVYLPVVERLAASRQLVLMGWSFGGNVAYELAAALDRRGRAPLATVLIDSWYGDGPEDTAGDTPEEAVGTLRRHGLVPEGLPSETEAGMLRVLAGTLKAFSDYRPTRSELVVDLVRATADEAENPYPRQVRESADRGIGAFAKAVRVHDIDADHYSVMSADHVSTLAAIFEGVLCERT